MNTNYVLVDFENVQPANLEVLAQHPFKIFIFVGANQTKVSFELAQAMQALGSNAQYIKISGNGHNALDFHIASYLGELASKEPDAYFHVISKDKGFDPLMAHLQLRNIKVQRFDDLGNIPILRVANSTSRDEKVRAIVKKLIGMGQSRPRKEKTLQNTINALFTSKLPTEELQELVAELDRKKYIELNEGKVAYSLQRK